jgi:hypothetical protein
MPFNEQYRAALTALALEVGLDAQDLNKEQTLIVGDVALSLSLTEDTGGGAIQCACKVGPLPPQSPVSALRLLLQANTLGPSTAGATFGLQHSADDLVLEQRHPLDMPPAALARACRAQAEAALLWAAAIAQRQPQVTAA